MNGLDVKEMSCLTRSSRSWPCRIHSRRLYESGSKRRSGESESENGSEGGLIPAWR